MGARTVFYGLVLVAVSWTTAGSVSAQLQFHDVGASRGIGPFQMTPGQGGGVSAADFDGDGDVDLFAPTAAGVPDQLYRNLGNGHYEEVAAVLGLASLEPNRAAVWFDSDGDGDLDLAVARDTCELGCNAQLIRLHRQQPDGTFVDDTVDAGLWGAGTVTDGMHVGGLVAGDLTGDGHLDLYLCYWAGFAHLFVNDGQGAFAEAPPSSGLGGVSEYWQPLLHDFNGDGWLDIHQNIDFSGNRLWINQQDGSFVDVAPSAASNNAMNDMGGSLGDFDNDGDFDIYVTNVTRLDQHNILLRNDSTPSNMAFTEVSIPSGVWSGGWGWGTTFLDGDRDGWLDIAATNGAWGPWISDGSRFYRNLGGVQPSFVDVSDPVQFNDTYWGSGLIAFDSDRDGDLDLVQACPLGWPLRLLENEPEPVSSGHHFLTIRPRSTGANSHAVGAVIRASSSGLTQSRVITAGTSFLSQEPAEAFFGLATASEVEAVQIAWPDGLTTEVLQVPTDQFLTVIREESFVRGDCNVDGLQNVADAVSLLDQLFGSFISACQDGCDVNDDGLVDIADPISLLGHLFNPQPGSAAISDLCTHELSDDTLSCSAAPCP